MPTVFVTFRSEPQPLEEANKDIKCPLQPDLVGRSNPPVVGVEKREFVLALSAEAVSTSRLLAHDHQPVPNDRVHDDIEEELQFA